jgi:3-hydroxyisobutyrate dehydrogenase
MLPNSDIVEAVLSEPALLEALVANSPLLVDMSSSEPLRTRALAAVLAERGLTLIDAPVSGGVSGATAGTLMIMVGGSDEDVASVAPVLVALGNPVHAGAVGSGHAAKALNNLLSATHLWITTEAVLAGERFGIEPAVLLSIFNGSSGRSGSTENKWPNFILGETYNSGFGLRLMLKDIKIAVELTKQMGMPTQLGVDAVDLWSRVAAQYPADADHTEVARWLRESNGRSAMAG